MMVLRCRALVLELATIIALWGVRGYRSLISPRRRKRCACGAVYGWEHSCSTAALRSLREHGLAGAVPYMRRQFAACADAYHLSETDGAGGAMAEIAMPLVEGDVVACCEVDVHAVAMRKMIVELFLYWVAGKYALAFVYHAGWIDGWFEGFVYQLVGTTFMGAAASMLWPIVALAFVLDASAAYALYYRKNASTYLAASFGLSVFVLFFDSILAGLVDLSILGSAWGMVDAVDGMKDTVAGNLIKKSIIGFWWPTKFGVLALWTAILAVLVVVNELSMIRGEE